MKNKTNIPFQQSLQNCVSRKVRIISISSTCLFDEDETSTTCFRKLIAYISENRIKIGRAQTYRQKDKTL